jgi:N6-adenosine-specific RNA methylase IME4
VTRGEALGEDVLAKVARTSLDKGEELDALAQLPELERNVLIDRAANGEKVSAKVEAKKQRRAAREQELGERQLAAQEGKFGVIVEDFEWDHETWSEAGRDRAAENHYPVAKDAHTAAEIVERTKDRFACADEHCVCFQWTTLQHLAIALDVMRLRGFTYKSSYAWGKDKIGLGYWSREKHEILLIGVKGNIDCPAPGTQRESLIMAPRGEHSAKPEVFLEMIEQYFPTLPKIELNRRGPPRPGWKAWGNETEHAAPSQAGAAPEPAPELSAADDPGAGSSVSDDLSIPDYLRRSEVAE